MNLYVRLITVYSKKFLYHKIIVRKIFFYWDFRWQNFGVRFSRTRSIVLRLHQSIRSLLSSWQFPVTYVSQYRVLFCWFASLGVSSHSRSFHAYGDVTSTITVEGQQILTYFRHSWPLGSEGSLACQTYCDTGLPFIMVISEDPWHSNLLPSV